jgi:flagellar protein FliS
MWQNAHDAYLDSRIMSANPLELVTILYQACIGSVRDARRHLANRDIAQRSKSITKAWEILTELTISLDRKRGGEISERLAELYDYMMRRLTEANFKQTDAPLAEVLGLLSTLLEGWQGIQESAGQKVEAVQTARAASAWGNPVPQESAGAYSSQGWSL